MGRPAIPSRRAVAARVPRHVGSFIAVGCAAAAVHWGVVVVLVSHSGTRPLMANVAGWLVAFGVSFAGHHFGTFRGHGVAARSAVSRFFVVSAGGFLINEAAYALLLHWGVARYDLALAMVLVAVAAITFVLSRHWAFLGNRAL